MATATSRSSLPAGRITVCCAKHYRWFISHYHACHHYHHYRAAFTTCAACSLFYAYHHTPRLCVLPSFPSHHLPHSLPTVSYGCCPRPLLTFAFGVLPTTTACMRSTYHYYLPRPHTGWTFNSFAAHTLLACVPFFYRRCLLPPLHYTPPAILPAGYMTKLDTCIYARSIPALPAYAITILPSSLLPAAFPDRTFISVRCILLALFGFALYRLKTPFVCYRFTRHHRSGSATAQWRGILFIWFPVLPFAEEAGSAGGWITYRTTVPARYLVVFYRPFACRRARRRALPRAYRSTAALPVIATATFPPPTAPSPPFPTYHHHAAFLMRHFMRALFCLPVCLLLP